MKPLNEIVDEVLRNVPETRNSDIRLMIEIWKRYYPTQVRTSGSGFFAQEYVLLKDLYDLPREDNIKRIRALLNAEGKYYPTDWAVAKARGIKEDVWRKELGYKTKGETVNPTKADSYMDEQRSFNNATPK